MSRESVTILHLSDTQFGRHHRFGNLQGTAEDCDFDSLVGRLEIDLSLLKRDYGVVPQSIVVTGDLAECGKTGEFKDVRELFKRCGTGVHRQLAFDKRDVLIVCA